MSRSTSSWSSSHASLTIPEGCMVFNVSFPSFSPDDIVSQETERAVDGAVAALCLPILFLISVPCNLLSMLVFWTQGLKERINLCLFYLSLVDFLHMIINFLSNADRIPLLLGKSSEHGLVMDFIVGHFMSGCKYGFSWLSGFISMVIASERCLCVCSPLRSQTFIETKTTSLIFALATVLILSGTILVGTRWNVSCVFDSAANKTSKIYSTSKFYAKHGAYLDVLTFFFTILQLLIYVTVVSATTIVTSVKLKKMVAWREQTSSSTLSSREVALTRMLIAVSVLYIVCSIPTVIFGACVLFVPVVDFTKQFYYFSRLMASLIQLASFVNAAFNFFVYYFLGSKFRETLSELLQRCSICPKTTRLKT